MSLLSIDLFTAGFFGDTGANPFGAAFTLVPGSFESQLLVRVGVEQNANLPLS